jgi:hypothetical protein
MTDATLDRLITLRDRWRAHEWRASDLRVSSGASFINVVWRGYGLCSPIGRPLDHRYICNSAAARQLGEAIIEAGGPLENALPVAPTAATALMIAHERASRTYGRPRRCVGLEPQVLHDAIAYARERLALLIETHELVRAMPEMRRELRAWQHVADRLEIERASAIQQTCSP